jgi:hypothetical protein
MSIKTYYELKAEFEKTHFKVINPFTYIHMMDDKPVFRSSGEMIQVYENLWCTKVETKTLKKNSETETTKTLPFVSMAGY